MRGRLTFVVGPCEYENSVKNHWYVHAFAEAFESSMLPSIHTV